jgi:hypothetical protein
MLRLLVPAFALALAGCWASHASPPAPANTKVAPAVATAPPSVSVDASDGTSFKTPRLPAVSADGSRVLLAIQDSDGARGNPNLRLELRDRNDRVVETQVVLRIEEGGDNPSGQAPVVDVKARAAAANKWLAQLHARLAFEPLKPLVVDISQGPFEMHVATGLGVTLDWRDSHLVLTSGPVT